MNDEMKIENKEHDGQIPVDTISTENLPAIQENAATLNELIDISCRRFRHLPATGMALEKPLSYKEFHVRILSLAAYLASLGVKRGDRVAILSENSHFWGMVYFAIVRLGAHVVPLFPDLPEADVHHILNEMECDIIFLTQRQIEKIYDLKKELSTVVTLDDYIDDTGLITLQTLSSFLDKALDQFAAEAENETLTFPVVKAEDIASVLYTSGTSGFSKAVVLSHENLCSNAYSASGVMDIQAEWVFLSVLPISHTYEFTTGFLLPLLTGGRVVYAGKTPTPAILQRICAKERPHVMLVVPLVIEKIFKKRVVPAVEKSKMLSFACRFNIGRKMVYKKIGSKLTDFFGGRLQLMGIGGAALNPEVETFLRDAGFPFLVGYGLTESSPLLAGGPHGDKTVNLGSVGKPVPRVEVRIDEGRFEDGIGEIQARGPNIMQGYLNDPEATQATFTEDGWLKTGDLGFLDSEGNLYIKGRSKSVIVLSNGENVYPEAIEHKVNSCPYVVESLVVENRGVLEVWVYPDYEFIDNKTVGKSRTQRHHFISSMLEEMRVEVNEKLPPSSRLSRVLERREPFIKTATHKIKRYLYSADNMHV
ncbi:AMP-binding protein [Desulfogranum marinum]|uniref:AMP-binding protein n=1 Tax=Desulfogranum marinum TaxID=453220 RepID=UPI001964A220|nr:AMP-binding protein [Desulfogranum marinum]MBM9511846.1 AMP-binding protein [Desulfogranum marinum]